MSTEQSQPEIIESLLSTIARLTGTFASTGDVTTAEFMKVSKAGRSERSHSPDVREVHLQGRLSAGLNPAGRELPYVVRRMLPEPNLARRIAQRQRLTTTA